MSETPVEISSFRRIAVVLTIGSFSIAALMGIAALLGGGEFGEGEGKVLLTTLVVGCASVCMLCYLATGGTPWNAVGAVGGLVLVLPLVTSLVLIWHDWDDYDWPASEAWSKWFGVGAVCAVTLAQVCLLLALAWVRPSLRVLLWSTIGLALVLAVIVSATILNEIDSEGLWRWVGVIAILDVLGTLVIIALAKFGRGAVGGSRAEADRLTLPLELEARLAERAAALGRSKAGLLTEAVERYLADPA